MASGHPPLAWLADRGLRDAAREAVSGPLVEEKVLVHGDYQHFNVLWIDGRLTGVVDWPTRPPATGAAMSATADSTWPSCSMPRRLVSTW